MPNLHITCFLVLILEVFAIAMQQVQSTLYSGWMIWGWVPSRKGDLSLLRNVQTCCVANPVSYAVRARDLFCWGHLMLTLITRATVPPLCLLCAIMTCTGTALTSLNFAAVMFGLIAPLLFSEL